jgi:hypothetical protein
MHGNYDPSASCSKQPSYAALASCIAAFFAVLATACGGGSAGASPDAELESAAKQKEMLKGKQIFRFDTFGDETFWSDTLRLHEVIRSAVDPTTALAVGLKVDVEDLPERRSSRASSTARST